MSFSYFKKVYECYVGCNKYRYHKKIYTCNNNDDNNDDNDDNDNNDNKNKDNDDKRNKKPVNNLFCLKLGDTVSMIIEKQKNNNNNKKQYKLNIEKNLASLYFIKNGNMNDMIIDKNISETSDYGKMTIKNSKIELNFDKFDYLIAISSVKCHQQKVTSFTFDTMFNLCDCTNMDGFEYEISIKMFDDNWKYQRLLWIAYFQNDKNNQCLLSLLPKDVINHIIKMIGQ